MTYAAVFAVIYLLWGIAYINPGYEKNNLENSLDHPWGMGVVRYHPELTRECRSF